MRLAHEGYRVSSPFDPTTTCRHFRSDIPPRNNASGTQFSNFILVLDLFGTRNRNFDHQRPMKSPFSPPSMKHLSTRVFTALKRLARFAKNLEQLAVLLRRLFRFLSVVVSILALYSVVFIGTDCSPRWWHQGGGDWACQTFGAETKSQLVEYLGWMAAAVISLALAWIGAVRSNALDKTVQAQNRDITESTLSRTREHYSRGLTHFGATKEGVRIGGAVDMLLTSFHPAMGEYRTVTAATLCGHIRDTTTSPSYEKTYWRQPSSEVSYIMRLLFGKGGPNEEKMKKFWEGNPKDLSGSYLAGCDLEGANFKEARMDEVCFNGANLKQARFYGAGLKRSKFVKATLTGATFMGAELERSCFWGASLEEARFQGSSLKGADFMRAFLHDTEFMGAQMDQAYFAGASSLHGGGLQRWHFRGAFDMLNPISMQNSPDDFKGRLNEGLNAWKHLPLFDDLPEDQKYEPFLKSVCFRSVLGEKEIKPVAAEIVKFRSIQAQDEQKIKERILEALREERSSKWESVKPDKNWDKLDETKTNYQQKDIEEWVKAYDENRETELRPRTGTSDPIVVYYPICPPSEPSAETDVNSPSWLRTPTTVRERPVP